MTSPTPVAARWDLDAYLPASILDEITDARIEHPRWVEKEAQQRRRRKRLAPDGRLVLAAVDHPARGVNEIRGDALAMGDRHQYLARTRRVLDDPDLDGVMATPDVLEELLILSHLERRKKGRSFLDGRVLVGSMNRGGLSGAAFEMDDTFTSMSAARIAELGFDGGKMMYRLDPQDPASGRTIQACAQALNDLRKHGLPGFLEPLGVVKQEKGYVPAKDAATLVRQCGIAAGLGDSSVHLWLKVPIVDDLARVCRATTLPLLLLGGPARGTAEETIRDFAGGLAAGARVRGAIIGRNLLFPGESDPLPMSRALTSLVHGGASVDEALRRLSGEAPRAGRARKAARG
jgi:DhnA family fructose-bisphosphate aldolase class Ia